ncbi:MAG: sugar transferase [Clostridia bacterium]
MKKKIYKDIVKRFFDIVCSFLGLIFLSPLFLLVAIIIKKEKYGSVIFKTQRIGKDGKPFKFYKFRSMSEDAPKDCPPALLESNKYITKFGKFIRKTSIDELPQLICILKGDMTIIGYRPCGFNEQDLVEERRKYNVQSTKPGLTGWAQVNGRDNLARNIPKKAWYDGQYVEKLSFWFDLKILFMTVKKVFKLDGVKEGACEGFVMEKKADMEAGYMFDDIATNEDIRIIVSKRPVVAEMNKQVS